MDVTATKPVPPKDLVFVRGAMGVGKSTVARRVADSLPRSAFLDGDWCWQLNPFEPTEEDREMVLRNIGYLLDSFMRNSRIDTVVLCWVAHEQWIVDAVVGALTVPHRVHAFSLTASATALVERLDADVTAGLRRPEGLTAALERRAQFEHGDAHVIDTTDRSADDVAHRVLSLLAMRGVTVAGTTAGTPPLITRS